MIKFSLETNLTHTASLQLRKKFDKFCSMHVIVSINGYEITVCNSYSVKCRNVTYDTVCALVCQFLSRDLSGMK